MKSVHFESQMRAGLRAYYLELEKSIETIETAESNGARKYKLLKYMIKHLFEHRGKVIYGEEYPTFKFRFEKGKLLVNNEEV